MFSVTTRRSSSSTVREAGCFALTERVVVDTERVPYALRANTRTNSLRQLVNRDELVDVHNSIGVQQRVCITTRLAHDIRNAISDASCNRAGDHHFHTTSNTRHCEPLHLHHLRSDGQKAPVLWALSCIRREVCSRCNSTQGRALTGSGPEGDGLAVLSILLPSARPYSCTRSRLPLCTRRALRATLGRRASVSERLLVFPTLPHPKWAASSRIDRRRRASNMQRGV